MIIELSNKSIVILSGAKDLDSSIAPLAQNDRSRKEKCYVGQHVVREDV